MRDCTLPSLIKHFLNYNANFSAKQALGDILEILLTVVYFPNRWGFTDILHYEYRKTVGVFNKLAYFQLLLPDFRGMIEIFKNIPDFFKEVKDGFSDTILKSMLEKLKKNAKRGTNAEKEEFNKVKWELLDYAEKK
jgi:hypothetical protein